MSKPAALPLFGDSYLADTTHLTTEEHGAYLLLMIAAWRQTDCSLPLDDKKLARIAGLSTKKWNSIKDTILDFWTIENGKIYQARLRKEHVYVCQKSEANKKSAEARWNKQPIEKQQNDRCERISERNAPPPPPIKEQFDKSNFVVSENHNIKIDQSEIDEAVECWNIASGKTGWPAIRSLNPDRRKKLSARLKEIQLDGWKEALRRAMRSGQLGHDPPSWFSFPWLIANSNNILKVLEGNYEKRFGENGNLNTIDATGPITFNSMVQAVIDRKTRQAGGQQEFL